ncbi:hypothetical protein GGX14DRAFT_644239 [Mycena pura]|uniref:Uncharacterized protein n=1 Tax=Mycena pura TaxID=153505 RepID=A0AAD6V943_9AGAR|nr:hypothetical protein GGX14DRAFT_644239 [Mycena pura]
MPSTVHPPRTVHTLDEVSDAPNSKMPPPAPHPFRPRQQQADMPPIARWNSRAAKFLAIRALQPPLTSRAACARHRLGRKTADRHHALMGRFDRMQTELNDITTRILRLHDAHTLLPAATLSADTLGLEEGVRGFRRRGVGVVYDEGHDAAYDEDCRTTRDYDDGIRAIKLGGGMVYIFGRELGT